MKEHCCQFGAGQGLAGIVCEPSSERPRQALILVSAGLLPKQGPFRLYAQLARRLAGSGVVTLRFDLGGIGDSALDTSGLPLRARTERDLQAAIDFLQQRFPAAQLVLAGLCSGAEDAFRMAARDPRVAGAGARAACLAPPIVR